MTNGTPATFSTPRMPAPGSMLWGRVHFDPDQDAGGGDEGGDKSPAAKTYSEEHVQRLIKERDQAKFKYRAVAEPLGLEDEYVDDEEKPGKRKLVIKGLDRITTMLEGDTTDRDGKPRKNSKVDELVTEHTTKVQKMTQGHQRMLAGRDAIIADLAVVNPLRLALTAEGAYDAEGEDGTYADLVTLLRPKLRTEIEEDEETGATKLVVSVLGDDGKPLTDAKGDRVSIRQYVRGFLDKRPHFRKSDYRPGPGAGGKGNGIKFGDRGRGTPSVQEHAQAAAASFYGEPAGAN